MFNDTYHLLRSALGNHEQHNWNKVGKPGNPVFEGIRALFLFRLWLQARFYGKHKNIRPYFLMCEPRTGSSLLLSYLKNSHQISALGEVFVRSSLCGMPSCLRSRKHCLRHIRNLYKCVSGPTCISKIFLWQCSQFKITARDFLSIFPDAQFIALYRRNLAEQLLSLEMAKKTNVWIIKKKNNVDITTQITLNEEQLKKEIATEKQYYCDFFANKDIQDRSLFICYEDLVASPDRLLSDSICPFLTINPIVLQTNLVKQNRRSFKEIVKNYEEVSEFLSSEEVYFHLEEILAKK